MANIAKRSIWEQFFLLLINCLSDLEKLLLGNNFPRSFSVFHVGNYALCNVDMSVHSTQVWNLKPQPWTSPDASSLWSLVFFLHLYSLPPHSFLFYPHLPSIWFFSVILSSFPLSFFLYSLILLWEAKKEMNIIEQTVCPWRRRQLADAPILSSIAWASHRVLG